MENSAKKSFKIIKNTAFSLKIITIVIVIAFLVWGIVIGIKNSFKEKEIKNSQVVAEIEYTDDIDDFSELDVLKNTFKIEIYDENTANDNITVITIFAIIVVLIKFILIICIFDGVQKLFNNLYKTDDGIITEENAKIFENIGIIALLRIIIPFIINIIAKYMVSSTISAKITLFGFIMTAVIIITSFGMYFKIKQKLSQK